MENNDDNQEPENDPGQYPSPGTISMFAKCRE